MKGYELKSKDEINFIESYEIVGEKIVVHMLNEKTIMYDYSKDVLDRVKALQEAAYKKWNKKETKKNRRCIGVLISLEILLIAIAAFLIFQGIDNLFYAYVFFMVAYIPNHFIGEIAEDSEELKKQRIYMENKEIFTDEVLEDKKLKKCLSEEKQKRLEVQKAKTTSAFNLTSIDELSLTDLKRIKEYIEKEKSLENKTNEKVKQKVINK